MKVLFFLLFIILFCYRVQVCKSERLNDGFGFYSNDLYFAQKQYDKYSKKYMRVNFPITYEKYPKRIPTFVDDTYCKYYERYRGCDHSRVLVVPDWYGSGCCRVLALNSVLNVYLIIKIRFIKYRFLKSMFRLRGRKRSTIAYKQSTPTFLSAIIQIMFHAKISQTHDIPTKLRS
jgi:hypothetical protein